MNLKCWAGFLSIQWNVIPSKVLTFLYVDYYDSGFYQYVSRYANQIYISETYV